MRSCKVGVWTVVAVGLLLGVLFLSGCGQKVAAPLPFEAITGSSSAVTTRVSLHGTVLDQNTGVPVSGAWVTLGTTARVQTGADGSYVFKGLLPETYYVSISSAGYITEGVAVIVGTADVFSAPIQLTKFEFIPNAEDVRGTETVEVSEEGVTTGTKAITSGVPVGELTVEEKKALFPATLVVGDTPVEIRDAEGDAVTKSPQITVTYLEQSQCPTPAMGAFGMSPQDVYTRPGTAVSTTQEVVIDGVPTTLTVETPNELLRKGSVVRASNVPFAGFVLEANGEQGWTFSEPQVLTINPANLSIPVNLLGAGLPAGTQIPFVDSDGEVHYATLREDGAIELEVTKIDTYLMQTNFDFNVQESDVTLQTGAAKAAAPQWQITSETQFVFTCEDVVGDCEIPDEGTRMNLIAALTLYLNLGWEEQVGIEVELKLGEQVVATETTSRIAIRVTLPMEGGGEVTLFWYHVIITVKEGTVYMVEIIKVTHSSGGGVG